MNILKKLLSPLAALVATFVLFGQVAVSHAAPLFLATIPAELQALQDDADTTWTWVKSFVLGIVVFSFIVWLVQRGKRKNG